jgi:hypothetical protein
MRIARAFTVAAGCLFGYVDGGHPIADCLDDFPSVARAQALDVLGAGISGPN